MPEILPRFGDVLSPILPDRRSQKELHRLQQAAGVASAELLHRQERAEHRLQTLATIGCRAMEAQTVVSLCEQNLVHTAPSAINGIAHLSQSITLGLGQVLNNTIREVSR